MHPLHAAGVTHPTNPDRHTHPVVNRLLRDVGRSVTANGLWGDVLNSPFHCFGTVTSDSRLLRVANKQYVHSSLDVAEANVLVRLCVRRQRGRCDESEMCISDNPGAKNLT